MTSWFILKCCTVKKKGLLYCWNKSKGHRTSPQWAFYFYLLCPSRAAVCALWTTSFSSGWPQQRRSAGPSWLLPRLHLPAPSPPSLHRSRRCSQPSRKSLAWTWNGPKSKSIALFSLHVLFIYEIKQIIYIKPLFSVAGVCKTTSGISTEQHKFSLS